MTNHTGKSILFDPFFCNSKICIISFTVRIKTLRENIIFITEGPILFIIESHHDVVLPPYSPIFINIEME